MSSLKSPKIVSLEEYLKLQTDPNKIVAFTNGCFDLLHPGHVDLLAKCKKYADILVLGLNSDNSVRRQNKGNDRPIVDFAARAFVLSHLESVDYIIAFDEDTPYNLIQAILPKVLIKGGDWQVDKIVGADIVKAQGGTVLSLPLLEGYSTTKIVEKIRNTKIKVNNIESLSLNPIPKAGLGIKSSTVNNELKIL